MTEWVADTVYVAFLGLLGKITFDWYKKRWPTKAEEKDIFDKTFQEATKIHEQLTDQLKQMVARETQSLKELLFKREQEHYEEIQEYQRKLFEANNQIDSQNIKIDKLEKRVRELENHKNGV